MSSYCSGLKSQDVHAFNLCKDREAQGDTLTELDRGVDRLDYSDLKKGPRRVWAEQAGNGKLSPNEIYRRYLDLIEQEEASRSRSYLKNLQKPPAFDSKILKLFKDKGDSSVPFVFDDLNPKTDADEKLFLLCLKQIQKIEKALLKQGLKKNTPEFREEMAKELFDFLQRPANKGGLGIKLDKKANRGTRNLTEIHAQGKATCLEFLYLYSALGRAAGLDILPIEVFRDQEGLVVLHVRAGLRPDPSDPDKILFFDISDGLAGERRGEAWVELNRLDLLGYYHNTLAIDAPTDKMEDCFKKALAFSPSLYMVLTNYARWMLEGGGKADQAMKLLEKSEQVNPFYPPTFEEQGKAYAAQGKKQEAKEAEKKAEGLYQPQDQ